MPTVISYNTWKKDRRPHTDGTIRGEERLIFLIAVKAYQDMVHYKRQLGKILTGERRQPVSIHIEQQYRYSVAFFLHPWRLPTQSYAAYLFSLIGRGLLMRRIQRTIRRLEAEVETLKRLSADNGALDKNLGQGSRT